eukprot:13092803-Alexandrium_andersonii.AAC.1
MSASLVGSEMCIRDSISVRPPRPSWSPHATSSARGRSSARPTPRASATRATAASGRTWPRARRTQ